MIPFEIETVRKVFDNENGEHIVVGPDVDGLGLLTIDGKDHYGGRLSMSPEMAIVLAEAIAAAAQEMISA